jgi:hypothetical protein
MKVLEISRVLDGWSIMSLPSVPSSGGKKLANYIVTPTNQE